MQSTLPQTGRTDPSLDEVLALDLRKSRAADGLHRLVSLVCEHVGAEEALLCLTTGERLLAGTGESSVPPPARRMCAHIARRVSDSGRRMIVEDLRKAPAELGEFSLEEVEFVSVAAVPLLSGEKSVIGVLLVLSRSRREWSAHEVDSLERFADLAVTELAQELDFQRATRRIALASDEWERTLKSAPLFRTLVEQSLVGIGVLQNWQFKYVNPRLAEIFGYTPEQMTNGLNVLEVAIDEDRPLVREKIRDRMSGAVETVHYRFTGERRDRSRIRVEVRGSRTELAGKPAIVSTVLDITEQEQALETAEEAVRARDELMAIVSHDLRNFLHSIRLSADLLLDSAEERRAENLKALHIISRAAGEMAHVVEDLLDITVMETGRFSVVQEPQDISALIEEACEVLGPIADQKSIALDVHLAEDLPSVMVDGSKLQRVLSNLISNAIKFSKEGGSVVVSVDRIGDEVQFRIADTGDGIPPEQLVHIFERFWQAHPGDRRGTGLGLAIAKGIVEAHGGSIQAHSVVEEGTVFTFTLPIDGSGSGRAI